MRFIAARAKLGHFAPSRLSQLHGDWTRSKTFANPLATKSHVPLLCTPARALTNHGSDATKPLNRISRTLTEDISHGAAQAMLRAAGLKSTDMHKSQIGIGAVWWEGNPCNCHLLALSEEVKAGVQHANMVGFRFNTIGVSDGISMGTRGMTYSLPSREIIADSIESVLRAQWYDGAVTLPGCDKNMPGCIIALARVNRPALMVYGGTIAAGRSRSGCKIDIVSAFQSYGEYLSGRIDDAARQDIVDHACPGPGACGGMYTANTMATAIEAMGMTLPYSSSTPAVHSEKRDECRRAGEAMKRLLAEDIRPRDIITRRSLENAIVSVMALGGSTNAVLHLLAIARAAGVQLSIDDFQRLSDSTPYIANLKPSGEYVMEDVHGIGGTPAILKYLLAEGLLHGDAITASGVSLATVLGKLPGLQPSQTGAKRVLLDKAGAPQAIIRPLQDPLKRAGHITILRGSLAPEGAVAKLTGKEGLSFTGSAVAFDSEEDFMSALVAGELHACLGLPRPAHAEPRGGTHPGNQDDSGVIIRTSKKDIAAAFPRPVERLVAIIRYEGPRGGPGMPEMLTPSSAIMGTGLAKQVALLTDGRFSGGSHGFLVGHISPEAAVGGPIALVRHGDIVSIDAGRRMVDLEGVHADELSRRKTEWRPPTPRVRGGALHKFAKLVSSASEGCITDA